MRSRCSILALLCVLAILFVPGIASVSTAASAKSRICAFSLAEQIYFAGQRAPALELHQGGELAEYGSTSGSLPSWEGGSTAKLGTGQVRQQVRRNAAGVLCFLAGTTIASADGASLLIESVELGQLVSCAEVETGSTLELGALALPIESWGTATDPDAYLRIEAASWRRVDLELNAASGEPTRISLLRPMAWLEAEGITEGVTFQLDLREQRLSGLAHVEAIAPAPATLSAGRPGLRPVTATFQSTAPGYLLLTFEDGTHLQLTASHPLYSTDRNTWVPAGRLLPGECLKTRAGPLRIESLHSISELAQVFNLEVLRSHTYFVGESQVLAHNDCMWKGGGNIKKLGNKRLKNLGIDAEALKKDFVGEKAGAKFNVSVGDKGDVFLTPVKVGSGPTIETGLKLERLQALFPKGGQ